MQQVYRQEMFAHALKNLKIRPVQPKSQSWNPFLLDPGQQDSEDFEQIRQSELSSSDSYSNKQDVKTAVHTGDSDELGGQNFHGDQNGLVKFEKIPQPPKVEKVLPKSETI